MVHFCATTTIEYEGAFSHSANLCCYLALLSQKLALFIIEFQMIPHTNTHTHAHPPWDWLNGCCCAAFNSQFFVIILTNSIRSWQDLLTVASNVVKIAILWEL